MAEIQYLITDEIARVILDKNEYNDGEDISLVSKGAIKSVIDSSVASAGHNLEKELNTDKITIKLLDNNTDKNKLSEITIPIAVEDSSAGLISADDKKKLNKLNIMATSETLGGVIPDNKTIVIDENGKISSVNPLGLLNISTLNNGQILVYNSETKAWENNDAKIFDTEGLKEITLELGDGLSSENEKISEESSTLKLSNTGVIKISFSEENYCLYINPTIESYTDEETGEERSITSYDDQITFPIDEELNANSSNPVQNKIIAKEINSLTKEITSLSDGFMSEEDKEALEESKKNTYEEYTPNIASNTTT